MQSFTGGLTGLGISAVLYVFASKVARVSRQALRRARRCDRLITVRTIVEGLSYLATFVYAANGVGLSRWRDKKRIAREGSRRPVAAGEATGRPTTRRRPVSESRRGGNDEKGGKIVFIITFNYWHALVRSRANRRRKTRASSVVHPLLVSTSPFTYVLGHVRSRLSTQFHVKFQRLRHVVPGSCPSRSVGAQTQASLTSPRVVSLNPHALAADPRTCRIPHPWSSIPRARPCYPSVLPKTRRRKTRRRPPPSVPPPTTPRAPARSARATAAPDYTSPHR